MRDNQNVLKINYKIKFNNFKINLVFTVSSFKKRLKETNESYSVPLYIILPDLVNF